MFLVTDLHACILSDHDSLCWGGENEVRRITMDGLGCRSEVINQGQYLLNLTESLPLPQSPASPTPRSTHFHANVTKQRSFHTHAVRRSIQPLTNSTCNATTHQVPPTQLTPTKWIPAQQPLRHCSQPASTRTRPTKLLDALRTSSRWPTGLDGEAQDG